MADPEMATSHTKRISYANYNYPSGTDIDPNQTSVDFYFRRGDIKMFQMVTLNDLASARATIAMKLNALSTSPTRVILLNDENKIDMPEVDLDELERIVKKETVLGSGRGTQVFVIVYDRDPTAARSEDGRPKTANKMPHQGCRRKVPVKECCAVA